MARSPKWRLNYSHYGTLYSQIVQIVQLGQKTTAIVGFMVTRWTYIRPLANTTPFSPPASSVLSLQCYKVGELLTAGFLCDDPFQHSYSYSYSCSCSCSCIPAFLRSQVPNLYSFFYYPIYAKCESLNCCVLQQCFALTFVSALVTYFLWRGHCNSFHICGQCM